MYSRRQITAIIILIILVSGLIANFWYRESIPFLYQNLISMVLSLAILVCFIWARKIPTQVTLNSFDYWFVIFPLVFVLFLYGLILAYEQIAINSQMVDFVPIDKFFKIGLGISLLTSLGSVMVLINADRRLRKIEKELFNKTENGLSELIKKEVEIQLRLELTKQKENLDKNLIIDKKNLKDYLMKEIDTIQSIINRMSNNSFLIKGWTITLVVGALLLERTLLTDSKIQVTIAFIPLLVFWFLDAYFLWQEKMYRKLYEWVIDNRLTTDENLLNMDATRFKDQVKSKRRIMFSTTLGWFYGSIVVLLGIYEILICYFQ